MKLYTYVEQGLAIKIAELNALKAENQKLKVHSPLNASLMVRKRRIS
jgi:hypothetical protein